MKTSHPGKTIAFSSERDDTPYYQFGIYIYIAVSNFPDKLYCAELSSLYKKEDNLNKDNLLLAFLPASRSFMNLLSTTRFFRIFLFII